MTNQTGPSLYLQCRQVVLDSLQAQFGAVETLRRQIHSPNSQTLQPITEWLDQQSGALLRPVLAGHEYDARFIGRIKQTIIEDLYSERLHPTLHISPIPMTAPVCDTVHCLLIDQLPNAYNELFPLMLDSYIHDLDCCGEARRLVIAAHVGWLDDENCITRGAFYSAEDDALIETPLDCVLRIDSVHFLCISPKGHKRASEKLKPLGLFEVNPDSLASVMDDKYECCLRWMGRGVNTPRATLIEQNNFSADEISRALKYLWDGGPPDDALVVAQPNRGTEGRGVKAFRLPQDENELRSHVQQIIKNDDALLRCGVEGAYLVHGETHEKSLFDVRINIFNGIPESGYIQAAPKNAVIASPSQGGRIVEWKAVDQYYVEGEGVRSALGPDLLRTAQYAAFHAAKALSDCLAAGVDVRLSPSQDQAGFEAWVLDVNPRPAGLGHSCYWNGEPGVTRRLWFLLPSIE
ncbi:hypothetical protein K8I31_15685 [bacterium]|nr:hypothetical protein [bacterium]